MILKTASSPAASFLGWLFAFLGGAASENEAERTIATTKTMSVRMARIQTPTAPRPVSITGRRGGRPGNEFEAAWIEHAIEPAYRRMNGKGTENRHKRCACRITRPGAARKGCAQRTILRPRYGC